jgi:N-acetylneuraminate lyase
MDALATGDAAKAAQLQQVAIEMIAICSGTGVTHLAASKTLMAMLGVDCGPVRMPLERPTPAQVVQLHATLQTAGFSDFACQPLRVAA